MGRKKGVASNPGLAIARVNANYGLNETRLQGCRHTLEYPTGMHSVSREHFADQKVPQGSDSATTSASLPATP